MKPPDASNSPALRHRWILTTREWVNWPGSALNAHHERIFALGQMHEHARTARGVRRLYYVAMADGGFDPLNQPRPLDPPAAQR